jgi:FKBP-type peptidyl-prolyl cis-trans isomerase FkpA
VKSGARSPTAGITCGATAVIECRLRNEGIMKSRTPGILSLQQGVLAAALVCVTACSQSASTSAATASAAPQPIAGDIERTTFAPALGVDLTAMTKRASGMYVQDVTPGTGAVATRGRSVVVRYTGWLPNGKQFDSGEISVTLGSNKTIAAWEEGLLGMRVGGKRRLVVPPNLGYGARGAGDDIPPNSVLVFDMEVTSVF